MPAILSNPFAQSDGFLFIGDLHENSSQFAIACEEAGADGIMLHLNHDSPNGRRFGGLELEEESLKQCLSVLKIPTGIMLGDRRVLIPDEWESCVNLGFSFVNMFAHNIPTFVWQDSRLSKLVSIGPGYILEQVKAISEFEHVEGIIAALTPSQGYGMPITLLDVATLGLITQLSRKPVFYPTQRAVRPEDLRILSSRGCKGLMIMKNCYGDSVQSCKEQVAKFRAVFQNEKRFVAP